MMIWEFSACIKGYNDKTKENDIRRAQSAIWTLADHKGRISVTKLLGYNPYNSKSSASIPKDPKEIDKRIEDNMGKEMTTAEVIAMQNKLKRMK